MALGSPLGLIGSVSEGIVSNMVEWEETASKNKFLTVQTDAAINPGNSGEGWFLKSSGELIGINTFLLSDTEGLNFALDVTTYLILNPYSGWDELVFVSGRCRDWTPYGECSIKKQGCRVC